MNQIRVTKLAISGPLEVSEIGSDLKITDERTANMDDSVSQLDALLVANLYAVSKIRNLGFFITRKNENTN